MYGLIFADQDEVWLGIYENGTIRKFAPISDFDGVYENLTLDKFSFIEMTEEVNDRVSIKDLWTIQVRKIGGEFTTVAEMLHDLDFPSEHTDDLFGSYLCKVRGN